MAELPLTAGFAAASKHVTPEAVAEKITCGPSADRHLEAIDRYVRAGYDHYRDGLNTPAFFEMLPDVDGLPGLDVGCGDGHNTRLLAGRGARVTGIDISKTFIRHAREAEAVQQLGIDYKLASAVDLPFDEASFDFATAFMSLMDIPETERVLAEVFRVLKPGGRLLFVEHVRSRDPGLARWQDRLEKPWRFLADGCHCNRDTLAMISATSERRP